MIASAAARSARPAGHHWNSRPAASPSESSTQRGGPRSCRQTRSHAGGQSCATCHALHRAPNPCRIRLATGAAGRGTSSESAQCCRPDLIMPDSDLRLTESMPPSPAPAIPSAPRRSRGKDPPPGAHWQAQGSCRLGGRHAGRVESRRGGGTGARRAGHGGRRRDRRDPAAAGAVGGPAPAHVEGGGARQPDFRT